NNKLVSEIEYLELWQVTEAYAGVYELTVNTGNKRLHKEFLISVQTTTTSLRTDPTESTQGPTDSPHTSAAISLTPTVSTDIQWPTQPNSSTVIVPAEGHITPSTTQSIASHLHNSSMPSNDVTELTSTQRTASDEMKNESSINRLYTEDKVSISTKEFRTTENILERTGHPRTVPTARATVIVRNDKATRRSHTLLVSVIVLLLLLIVMVVILYWRQLRKKRMDLPPPFKPPPPPVKYTAARRSETQLFPTSRCNSISEPMKPLFI
ncbi:hypothetical protein AMECASPLE_024084, partial [Ameca splendens]